ncbi:MAG TPA: glycosyltransferase family 2 protein [Gemmatimonadales bacterium]|nr:glycosyltransferase family 2 protein [Gemmatimonadales bacterium]
MNQSFDFTILLATRNRAELLADTLAGIAAQHLPGLRWEVIVVDNGSTDGTPEVLAEAAAKLPLVQEREPAPGKNRALNRGLALARGELVIFTDDDIVPDAEWISELLNAAARWPDAAIFGGRITPIMPPETPEWLAEHPFTEAAYARFELDQPEGRTSKLPFGPNFAVRARALDGIRFHEAIGPEGDDYISGGEIEFLQRLERRGETIVYVPSARVGHVVRRDQLSVDWLFGRSYRLGRCLVELGFIDRRRAPRVGGVPVYVWPRLAKEWLYSLSGFGSERRRFVAGLDYHFQRGCVRQHRVRNEKRETGSEKRGSAIPSSD